MFTGIIEECGVVEKVVRVDGAIQLVVRSRLCSKKIKLGDSIAVNGCCLTAAHLGPPSVRGRRIRFDLLEETWNRTSFSNVIEGSLVNLERALRADGRLGGHFVTGHVDGTGLIRKWNQQGNDHILEIDVSRELRRLIVLKGSIAVDGISLTVAGMTKGGFRIWIIPFTLEMTVLKTRAVGDLVNIETDIIGKYVETLIRR
jgi:riboflavin synthase